MISVCFTVAILDFWSSFSMKKLVDKIINKFKSSHILVFDSILLSATAGAMAFILYLSHLFDLIVWAEVSRSIGCFPILLILPIVAIYSIFIHAVSLTLLIKYSKLKSKSDISNWLLWLNAIALIFIYIRLSSYLSLIIL